MKNRPTASALPRAFACTASLVLPGERLESKWADRGTAIHTYLRHVDEVGHEAALALVPHEHRDACSHLALDPLPPGTEREVAYAYDVATGEARRLGVDIERDYEAHNLGPFEIPGTLDAEWVTTREDGTRVLWIWDYKSALGKRDPASSAAMLFYALCAWKYHGEPDEVWLCYINTDLGTEPREQIDMFDLLDFADRLRQLQLDVAVLQKRHGEGVTLPVSSGAHCKYCPALHVSCPAAAAMVRRLSTGDLEREIELAVVGQIDSDERAAEVYELYQFADAVTRRLRTVLYARAADRPIPLRSGGVLGPVTVRGKREANADAIADWLRITYGPDAVDEALERKVTFKRLETAVKRRAKRGQKGKEWKRAEALLTEQGAITPGKERTEVREYQPRKELDQ